MPFFKSMIKCWWDAGGSYQTSTKVVLRGFIPRSEFRVPCSSISPRILEPSQPLTCRHRHCPVHRRAVPSMLYPEINPITIYQIVGDHFLIGLFGRRSRLVERMTSITVQKENRDRRLQPTCRNWHTPKIVFDLTEYSAVQYFHLSSSATKRPYNV
jgi:hypothetical protein